jgi:hypothetical protein
MRGLLRTIDIELAVMREFDHRQNLIVNGINSWAIEGLFHECDMLVVSKAGFLTEIEIKVSKADLIKDKLKQHGHRSSRIKRFYFAVPEKLVDFALEEIPERAGLYAARYVEGNLDGYPAGRYPKIRLVKQCQYLKTRPVSDAERYQIARLGAMRIYTLKKRIARHYTGQMFL